MEEKRSAIRDRHFFPSNRTKVSPGLVSFQLDVFWVAWGGATATDVIEKPGPRIGSLHPKDLARDTTPHVRNPKSARYQMVRLAADQVDIPAAIATAKAKSGRIALLKTKALAP